MQKSHSSRILKEKDPDLNSLTIEIRRNFIQAEYEDYLIDHLAFQIKNMEETISMMRREKVTITDEPYRLSPTGGLIAFIEDPDGILI